MIKPLLRGRDIAKYEVNFANLYIINSHNNPPVDINKYPAIKEHLDKHYEKLSDKGVTPYNLRNCAYLDEFEKEAISWQRVTKEPTFCLSKYYLYLDSMAFLTSKNENLKPLIAFLNSKTIYFYIDITTHQYSNTGYLLSNQFILNIPIIKLANDKKTELANLVDEFLDIKSKIKLYQKHLPTLNTAEKIEINEQILTLKTEFKNKLNLTDELIYKFYGLSSEEINYIKSK
ncbi:MAG: hypothetical protein GXZ15_00610 [Campylobacter sp.]|nr:hypothetical protein [Campylobacter sp.]